MPRFRFATFLIFAFAGITALFILSPASRDLASRTVQGAVDVPQAVKEGLYNFDIPAIHSTFHRSSHKPPVQKNSTNGDSSWYSDWRWLNPFSTYITWDQDRVVLPPLPERPYVYTYYDTAAKRDKDQEEAEANLLLTWRRAWWAQGFRPVILTRAEAMNHPLYASMRAKGMQKVLEFEFERWLAWGHMGTGILASWHAFPMAAYDDVAMKFLRRNRFEKLTRFQGLEAGLFAGEKSHINEAIEDTLGDAKLSTYKTIIEAIHPDRFKVEWHTAIAHYSSAVIDMKYGRLSSQLLDHPVKGLESLNQLVNAHLHTIWQNVFNHGIRVLKPLPAHTSKLVEPAQRLAQLLAECPESIAQSSCPPNNPNCKPCVGSKMQVETKPAYLNDTFRFTLATVPHPYTMITLNHLSSDVTVRHIRRETERDDWVKQVTRVVLGDGVGGANRVVGLKNAVASDYSRWRGVWFTVEHFPPDFDAPPAKPKSPTNDPHPEKEASLPFPEHWLENLDWFFGFSIPRTTLAHGQSYNPVPGQSNDIKGLPAERKGSYEPDDPTYKESTSEVDLLRKARDTISSKDKEIKKVRDAAEAWNLADTEVWKFARAYRAQAEMERKQWEQDEAAYASPGSSRGGRWI